MRMREEARGAHTAFRDSCDSDSHGMEPNYNPANAQPRGMSRKFTAKLGKRVRVARPFAKMR